MTIQIHLSRFLDRHMSVTLLTAAFASAQQASRLSAANAQNKQDEISFCCRCSSLILQRTCATSSENTLAGIRLNTNVSD
jgi:hypothetical protein